MNSSFVAALTKQITTAIRDTFAQRLADEIDAGHQEGKDTLEILQQSLSKLLLELPSTVTTPPPVSVPVVQNVQNTVAPSTQKATNSRSNADVLVDAQGQPLNCEMQVKKTGQSCKNKAKHRIGGQALCGVHAKSANNAQADPNKKAGKTNTPAKGTSTFGATIGLSNTTSNDFASFNVEDSIDINDE